MLSVAVSLLTWTSLRTHLTTKIAYYVGTDLLLARLQQLMKGKDMRTKKAATSCFDISV